MCVCVLFSCFKMKVPRSPLPGKSLEQAWKASEAGVKGLRRAGGRARAAPGAKRGEGGDGGPSGGVDGRPGAHRSGPVRPGPQARRRPTALAGRRD